jgi:molecular chaperone GrpE (heat shock protein)
MENAMANATENAEQAIRRTIEVGELRIAHQDVSIHRQRGLIAQLAKTGHTQSLREAQAELKNMLAQWEQLKADVENARQRLLGPIELFDQGAIDGIMNTAVVAHAP